MKRLLIRSRREPRYVPADDPLARTVAAIQRVCIAWEIEWVERYRLRDVLSEKWAREHRKGKTNE